MRMPQVLLLLLFMATTCRAQSPPPEPDSLMNWLKIIDVPGYRLLHASDQNGFYFAVKIDADGDILFCHHEQTKPTTAAGTSTIRIDDPKSGADLRDPKSKKLGPDPVTLTYVREIPDGVVRIQTALNITFPTGTVLPLANRDINAVHITYTRKNDQHEKTVVFDQLIQLPKTKPKPADKPKPK